MSRTPKPETTNNRQSPKATAAAAGAAAMIAEVESPVSPYPARRGGRAIPDRSRAPDIGAACHDTRKDAGRPLVRPEHNAGPSIGPTDSGLPAKQSAYARARREGRG
jgi:hypothetical protein